MRGKVRRSARTRDGFRDTAVVAAPLQLAGWPSPLFPACYDCNSLRGRQFAAVEVPSGQSCERRDRAERLPAGQRAPVVQGNASNPLTWATKGSTLPATSRERRPSTAPPAEGQAMSETIDLTAPATGEAVLPPSVSGVVPGPRSDGE